MRLIEAAIAEFRGALLADEPGLGKTFVALAVASRYRAPLVVAPAALVAMWRGAAAQANVPVALISLEALSRGAFAGEHDFLIVDEAHHAANPATVRWDALAIIASKSPTLLLSATPLRNRQSEVDALLALFLGARAQRLDDPERARCIIRRESSDQMRPRIIGPTWHPLTHEHDFAREITALPPAVPVLDGGEASALITMTLIRCWASSIAALDRALKRRLQRGAALDAILASGRLPTRTELRAWILGDDAVQLAFPLIASHETADAARWRGVLDAHLTAVRILRARVTPLVVDDASARADTLRAIAGMSGSTCTIAFTTFAATAESLYAAMRFDKGVALLTARGARTASGERPRDDIIAMLGPDARHGFASPIDTPSLVIATDVLSEGVNLQRADTIVHLDLPWTPSGLEQRVGRAARIDSAHSEVRVHGIAPPRAAMRAISMHDRLVAKRTAAQQATRAADDREALASLLSSWKLTSAASTESVAAVQSTRGGFLAVIRDGERRFLVGGFRFRGGYVASDTPDRLRLLAEAERNKPAAMDPRMESLARAAIARFLNRSTARDSAGLDGAATPGRRIVLDRLDRILATLPASDRPRSAPRITRLRESVVSASGAATDRALDLLARDRHSATREWLAALERIVAGRHAQNKRAVAADPRAVTALLLLVREPAATSSSAMTPAPSRGRRSPLP